MSRVSEEYLKEVAERRTWKWMEIAPEILMARKLRALRKVVAALKPFISDAVFESFYSGVPDDESLWGKAASTFLTVGDFRKIKEALAKLNALK